MDKYIKFECIEKWILTESASLDGEEDRKYVVERLRAEIPAADVRPVVRGKWETISFMTVRCSNCKETFHELESDKFCPNCGADMREAPDA